jgi:hypothetical protein
MMRRQRFSEYLFVDCCKLINNALPCVGVAATPVTNFTITTFVCISEKLLWIFSWELYAPMKKFTIVGIKERTKDENRSLVAFTALNAFHQSTLQKIKGTLFRNVFKVFVGGGNVI